MTSVGSRPKKGAFSDTCRGELRQNLGQILLGFGLVTEHFITKAYKMQRQSKKPIAKILLEEGFVKEETVRGFLGEAARDTVFDLFLEAEGAFVFSDSEDIFELDEVPLERVPLELDMEEAILEGMRRMDEWAHIWRACRATPCASSLRPHRHPASDRNAKRRCFCASRKACRSAKFVSSCAPHATRSIVCSFHSLAAGTLAIDGGASESETAARKQRSGETLARSMAYLAGRETVGRSGHALRFDRAHQPTRW